MPRRCRVVKSCSPSATGTRKSLSLWMMSIGVLKFLAYRCGECFPCDLRSAVHEERQRPLLAGIEAGRLKNPHLHLGAGDLDRHTFRTRQIQFRKQRRIVELPAAVELLVTSQAKFGGMVERGFTEC